MRFVTDLSYFFLLLPAVALAACGRGEPSTERFFSAATKRVRVEIAYESNALPYTSEDLETGFDAWGITRENLREIFAPTTTVIEVPSERSGMRNIGVLGNETYTPNMLADLADSLWPTVRSALPDKDGVALFRVLYLDGYLLDGKEPARSVLGVSVGSTGMVALFKPVVRSIERSAELLASISPVLGDLFLPYVEQSTMVHELGHAIGLVDNGLPLMSDHYDDVADRGGSPNHCANPDCVMYFANNSSGQELAKFVVRLLNTGDAGLFGDECLGDIQGARERQTGVVSKIFVPEVSRVDLKIAR